MKNNELKFFSPADEWTSALPLGNGRLGCMVFGDPVRERIQFNEDSLWSGIPQKKEEDIYSEAVNKVRSLINQGHYSQAQKIADQKLLGPWSSFYEPAGDIFLDFPDSHKNFSDYSRSLDLEKALCSVSYKADNLLYTREIFTSHPADAIIIKLDCSKAAGLSFKIRLSSLLKYQLNVNEDSSDSAYFILRGKAPVSGPNTFGPDEEPVLYDDVMGMNYTSCLRVKVYGNDAHVKKDHDSILVNKADRAELYLTAATSFNGFTREAGSQGKDCDLLCRTMDKKVSAFSYEELYQEHVKDFSSLFNKVQFELKGENSQLALKKLSDKSSPVFSRELAPLFFNFGRYLLISSSRQGSQPANLQGIWNQDIRPAWNCNYTTNINLEMNYWPAEVCNLSECHLPLFDLIKELSVTGRDVAKYRWKCRGWAANHNCDLWRKASPAGGSSEWALWPLGGAWLCTHIWEHYIHTGDMEFLRDMYPALKGCVEFLMDFLQKDKDGYLVTNPSISPENNFIDPETNNKCCLSRAGTMDMSIIREVFTQYKIIAGLLNLDEDFAKETESAIEKLFPYGLTKDGRLREWCEDFKEAEAGHRHVSHLFGIYPGHLLFEKGEEKYKAAAEKSLLERLSNGGGHTGWSCAWTVCLFARFKKAAEAEKYLDVLFNKLTYKNLFNVCPPYQIDGNFGGTAAITEMLVHSGSFYDEESSCIELLPCLPQSWTCGSIRGLKVRGAYIIDMEWRDLKLKNARIRAKKGGKVRISYNNSGKFYNFNKDDEISLDSFLESL
ncbi:glycoside hydrolase N-terminal domain-containing protein [Treponema sp.]|uniref:glycoside hydrolase family 95 protein n=1 Tax=Treponema sp. TaxID=166 RepID=UPI0025F4B484|nr:glycoside hydrolase N-terminal domain-containing protein [Treponema sp.]MCR5217635.1 glycoside hydrolase N-terminal domain-containing protein [Treponema sp.]